MISRPRVPRVRRSTLFLIITVAALAFPLGVLANHDFDDVPTGASYHDDVSALVAAGITSGCGGNNYCPGSPVTRGQMAQFMNRLGDLDRSFTPSVNADETDDWDVGCPAGTTWAGALCIETSARAAANVYDASATCQQLGGTLLGRGQQWTLPNSLTLRSAHNADEITFVDGGEWSSDIWVDDANGYQAMVGYNFIGGAALLVGEDASASHQYRCGAVPLSFDGITIIPLSGTPESDLPAAPESEFVPVPLNEDGTPAD